MTDLLNIEKVLTLSCDGYTIFDYVDRDDTVKMLNGEFTVSCENKSRLLSHIEKCNRKTSNCTGKDLLSIGVLLDRVIKHIDNTNTIDNKVEAVKLSEAEHVAWLDDFAKEDQVFTTEDAKTHNEAKRLHVAEEKEISHSEAEHALFEMDANNTNEITISEAFGSTCYTRAQCLNVMYPENTSNESILDNLGVEVTDTYIHTDDVTISILDNSVNNELKCLDNFTVQFTVEYKEKEFLVAYQSAERSNGMRAYSGFELSYADTFGYDCDESSEFVDFIEENEEEEVADRIADLLFTMAEDIARAELAEIS